jgi:hypothetical protein
MDLVDLTAFLSSEFGYTRFNVWPTHPLFRLCMSISRVHFGFEIPRTVLVKTAVGFIDSEFEVASVCCELVATGMGNELHSYLHSCHLERAKLSRDALTASS